MAGKGKPWENPTAESVIGHLKDGLVWVEEFTVFQYAHFVLSHFLDSGYNYERLHSSLGYLTPAEFEAQYAQIATGFPFAIVLLGMAVCVWNELFQTYLKACCLKLDFGQNERVLGQKTRKRDRERNSTLSRSQQWQISSITRYFERNRFLLNQKIIIRHPA